MTIVIEQLGAWAVIRVQEMGRMLLFVLSAFAWLVRPPFRFHQIMKQLHFIGYKSTFVVVLTAGFTGMVLALQGYYTLAEVWFRGVAGLRGGVEHDPGVGAGVGCVDGDRAGRISHDRGDRHHADYGTD